MHIEMKLASNLAPFARLRDRFVADGYRDGDEFRVALDKLAKIDGIRGVALGCPGPYRTGAELRGILQSVGLELATFDADIYTEARFRNGSLSNPDSGVRRQAIDRIKESIDMAAEAGAPDMNLWLGHDGFDYPFQAHYADAWQWIVEGMQEVAGHNSDLPISLEYKCKEPRPNQYVANVGRALLLVNAIDRPHVGITLDTGHGLAGLENAAESAALALRAGRLQQVHLNDNYRDWDHDLIPGTINLWEFIEFFYWVRKLGYRGWYSLDVFPYRDEGTAMLQASVQACRTCWMLATRLLEMDVERLFRTGQHLEIKRILWEMIGNRMTVEGRL